MIPKKTRFAMCIRNEDCEDLQTRKVYAVLPDPRGEKEGYFRIVDDSGEDYLYPQSCFVLVRLPRAAQREVAVKA